jgi:hypothetical protein
LTDVGIRCAVVERKQRHDRKEMIEPLDVATGDQRDVGVSGAARVRDGQLAVGRVLVGRVMFERHAGSKQFLGDVRVERIAVADHDVRLHTGRQSMRGSRVGGHDECSSRQYIEKRRVKFAAAEYDDGT